MEYSEKLAVTVATLCEAISNESNICFQIKKSSSSVYANIREANYGQSPADMISKFEIALKEAFETGRWLEMIKAADLINEQDFSELNNLCIKIRVLLISSIRTLKSKL